MSITSAIVDYLEEEVFDILVKLESSIIANDHVASGRLRDSAYDLNKNPVTTDANGNVTARVRLSHYWKYVDRGRPAGALPSIRKLERWVKDKGITPDKPALAKKKNWQKRLAFAIAKKIADSGTVGRGAISSVLDITLTRDILERMKPMISDEVYNQNMDFLNEFAVEVNKGGNSIRASVTGTR